MNLIHVVIPVYNAISYLRETVASVLNQPYKGIDIVLVDDGSKDGSSEMCDELSRCEKRIHTIHQKNSGVSVARNVGVQYYINNFSGGESSEYIAFLDADDMWCANVFTEQLLNRIVKENADIVGFSTCSSNTDATKFRLVSQYSDEMKVFDSIGQTEFLWAKGTFAAHLYNIEHFKSQGIIFDPSCKQNEDVIFSAKMLFCSRKIVLFEKVLYIYRMNMMSVTHTARYLLDGACHIPDAWHISAFYFENAEKFSRISKDKWKDFCLTTSSIRCLEVIRMLSLSGYLRNEIEECFSNKIYYDNIYMLEECSLAEWQRNDLKMYKNDKNDFYRYYRKQSFKFRIKRFISRFKCVRKMFERIRYTVTIDEICK